MAYKNNHFVFEFYLKRFSNNSKNLWVYFKDTKKIEYRNKNSVGKARKINSPLYEKFTSHIFDDKFTKALDKTIDHCRNYNNTGYSHTDNLDLKRFIAYLQSHNIHLRNIVKQEMLNMKNEKELVKYFNESKYLDLIAKTLYDYFSCEYMNYRSCILHAKNIKNDFTFTTSDFPVYWLKIEKRKDFCNTDPLEIVSKTHSNKLVSNDIYIQRYRYTISLYDKPNINITYNPDYYIDLSKSIAETFKIKNIKIPDNVIIICPLAYDTQCFLIKNERMQYEINYLFRHREIAKLLNWHSFATMQKELYAKDRNMLDFLENNTSIVS